MIQVSEQKYPNGEPYFVVRSSHLWQPLGSFQQDGQAFVRQPRRSNEKRYSTRREVVLAILKQAQADRIGQANKIESEIAGLEKGE